MIKIEERQGEEEREAEEEEKDLMKKVRQYRISDLPEIGR